MTKRRLLRWSLLLVTLAACAVWLEPTRVVWGWLRGEAFYQGRPTSYWSRELERLTEVPVFRHGPWEGVPLHRFWIRQPSFLEEKLPFLFAFTAEKQVNSLPLLEGDKAA